MLIRSRHVFDPDLLLNSALNTGVRSIIFSPDRANPYSVLSRALYPHSAQLQLWRHSNEEIQRRFPLYVSSQRVGVENLSGNACSIFRSPITILIFDTIPSDDIEYPNLSGPHRYGYFKLSLESPRSRKTQQTLSQKEFSSLFLRGGLFGPMELLRALGCWRQVYLSAWLLPPVVTCGNFQVKGDGLAIETLCGVSGETALSWGTPRMALVEARERDRRFTDDPNKPACTGDADLWASEPQRKMYIEIVIKVTKDRQRSADVARELFAEEVIRAVAAVAAHSRWIIHELSVDDCCSDNEKEFSGERLIVYPLAKVAVSERGGLPKWASHSFMTALRVRGEAMAECAVLMGQEVDTGAPEASHFQPSTQSGAMSANESGIIAQQLEANMPLESVPSMFPALLESFKSICGMAKQRERTSERSERPVADKWWGGGEGWRGTDSDAAHDMDPTAREAHRSNVFSAATHRVQAAVGMREDIPRVYVPCQLRFSLLCFTSSEKCTDLDESEAVNSVGESAATNSDAPTAVKLNKMSTIFMRAANKAKLVSNMTDTSQGLAIGAGRVISRLIGSTVWLSTDAAVAVWSCLPLNESISIDKHAKLVKAVIAAESKAQLQEAHKLYRQHPSDYIRAYQHAGLSLSLSADINSFQRLFPDVVRMNESLASRARALADTLRMLRQILDRPRSGAGECLGLTNLDALSATLVIHVSLSVRLLVASPQCVHLVGGMYPVLLLVFKLETNFQLGHYSLNTGMRFGCDGMHESGSAWKLPLPTIDRETQAEMIEKRVSIDGSTGIRRAIAVGGDALEQLVDIILSLEGMCSLIADALAEDVHCCSRDSIGDFISSSSFKEEPISQTLNLGQLMKRMDKKGVVQKKVAFIEPIKIDNAEVKVSESKSLEPDEEFEVRSTAFLSAIQESLMLPTEREVKDRLEPNIAEEDGTPSVLVGRMRRPLPQGKIYGPNAITMLDDLRNMQSRK